MEAARERGDDFGPFAWRHEVSHPPLARAGRRRRRLIADAVFTYLRIEEDGVAIEQRFLEIDRATLTVDRLAAELPTRSCSGSVARTANRCGARSTRSSRPSTAF